MGKFKGAGIVFVREFVQSAGNDCEARTLDMLSAEDQEYFEQALATSWVPIETANAIICAAAEVVHPGDERGLRRVGAGMAISHLRGVYRILLRVSTVNFALSQTANYWRAYHDHGSARVERGPGEGEATLFVEGYPRLPETFREFLCGYIEGMMTLTGARDGLVERGHKPPNVWIWKISWK